MNISEEFQNLIVKFLFFNSNVSNEHQNLNKNNDLNLILNEINSLNHEKNIIQDTKAAINLLENFTTISSNEETLIVKSCYTIIILLNKQKIKLPEQQFDKIILWLSKCLELNDGIGCDCLAAMQALFKNHPQFCLKHWNNLLTADCLLMRLFDISSLNNSSATSSIYGNYDGNSKEEILSSNLCCIEALITSVVSDTSSDEYDNLLASLGNKVLHIFYSKKLKLEYSAFKIIAITSSLNILNKIASLNQHWCSENVGELIGFARTFLNYDIKEFGNIGVPQKVMPSQQSMPDERPIDAIINKGGKIQKQRKPRTVSKNKHKSDARKNKKDVTSNEHTPARLNFEVDILAFTPNLSKTSDSDFSESDMGRAQSERQKQAKLRLSAITLLGMIAKQSDKKTLYGFWHSLFPNQDVNTVNLLNCVQRDPNPRCRLAALQTASVILHNSKIFLWQAENLEKPPTAYMPFSIWLGYSIISIYEDLTKSLASENSIPVLTQILKCLTVLIQATPFTRLKGGFVKNFVDFIRKLVYHKDITIQVAALMVMEFLILNPDKTPEIIETIGLPKETFFTKTQHGKQNNDLEMEEVIENDIYDEIEMNSENENSFTTEEARIESNSIRSSTEKMSWLLQRILDNLGVKRMNLKNKINVSSNPVRIECLQVLAAMATHFLFIKDHLELIVESLTLSIKDSLAEVRLYAGKCLDAVGHSMNIFLLDNCNQEDATKCQKFWMNVLTMVIEKVGDPDQSSALKCVLCDFLSNIGAHIFEKLSHNVQIQLISLLSGISLNKEEESSVRASALRALAVYVMFPSLRENLCFIENTAECFLELIKDKNALVRIKSSWSLGNISDALITNCLETDLDRISDSLLKRLMEQCAECANDNDKVRCNIVRTLGNLLRLITKKHLESLDWRKCILKSIKILNDSINSGNNAKVKWNSCYALGNVMKNTILFENNQYSDLQWQTFVFSTLSNAIVNNSNFKVRINGATALIAVTTRKFYRKEFLSIWSSLLSAIEQSDNLVDFNEYKHRDNLQEQLCICLCHFIKVATLQDFIQMKNELIEYEEIVKEIWERVNLRILPQHSTILVNTSLYLKQQLEGNTKESNVTTEQIRSFKMLSTCFSSPIEKMF